MESYALNVGGGPGLSNPSSIATALKRLHDAGEGTGEARSRFDMVNVLNRIELEGLQTTEVLLGEDGGLGQPPLAAATLLIEPKFTRGGASAVAHVSELVGIADHRLALLLRLVEQARAAGCYKVIIDAPATEEALLTRAGFSRKEATMIAVLEAGDRGYSTSAASASPLHSRVPRRLAGEGALAEVKLRPLEESDGASGAQYVTMLEQLTKAPALSPEVFCKQLARVRRSAGMHVVLVAEQRLDDGAGAGGADAVTATRMAALSMAVGGDAGDVAAAVAAAARGGGAAGSGGGSSGGSSRSRLVGCGTLVLERTPLRSGGLRCHIEEVVVDTAARGAGIGRALVCSLLEVAAECGADSASLNCADENVGFYEKVGFRRAPDGVSSFALYF